ncbi:diguanylate cyclase, partial [Frankia sp. CN6]
MLSPKRQKHPHGPAGPRARRGRGGRLGGGNRSCWWGQNRSRRQGRLATAVPLVTGAVLAVLLALAALLVGRWQLGHAEHERLANRVGLVQSIADYRSRTDDPRVLQAMVEGAGFSPTDAARDAGLLPVFDLTPTGNPTVAVALMDPSGRAIAVRPTGTSIPVDQLGPAWRDALGGRPGWSSAFDVDGQEVRAALAPIGASTPGAGGATTGSATGENRPRAVLVALSIDTAGQRFQERLGVLGTGAGGLSQLDRDGVAISSWAPAEVGRRHVDPARLAGLRPGHAEVWQTRGADGHERTVIAAAQRATGYVTTFEASTQQLYGDLRAQQASRDRALVGVLGGSVLGLVLFGVLRELGVRRARARLYDLLGNTHDVIVLVRDGLTVVFMSPSARRLLGQADVEWVDQPLLDLVHPDDRERVAAALTRLPPGETTLADVRLRAGTAPNGAAPLGDAGPRWDTEADAGAAADVAGFRWFDLTAVDERGTPDLDGVVITCHEVGERKALQDRLSHQARHDPLTGLPNRATFLTHLVGALTTSAADGTRNALFFIDLDGFKPINDRHGHDVGDHVLRVVGRRLAAVLGANDLASRFGGDEFGVLVREAEPATARLVADRLAAAVAAPIGMPKPDGAGAAASTAPAEHLRVSASIGVALSTPSAGGCQTGYDANALLRAADQAMYEAKRAGPGAGAVFAPDPAPAPGAGAAGRD